jgi:integrase
MRPSEIIALKWSKVDFKKEKILVDLCRVDGIEDLPKGQKSREIDILPQALEALQRQHFLTNSVSDHVFITQYGKPYQTTKVLDNLYKELLAKIEMPIVRFYTTKKSFITLMKSKGMNESWIIQQVGHEDKLVSRAHYTAKVDQNFDLIKEIAV